mmetsp:Transcript_151169/g.485633  ORF Transcript_151169/g.485633 Transcript_151169/m.485633 type:complete len:205 (-) Transcript_151169:251-865(-)
MLAGRPQPLRGVAHHGGLGSAACLADLASADGVQEHLGAAKTSRNGCHSQEGEGQALCRSAQREGLAGRCRAGRTALGVRQGCRALSLHPDVRRHRGLLGGIARGRPRGLGHGPRAAGAGAGAGGAVARGQLPCSPAEETSTRARLGGPRCFRHLQGRCRPFGIPASVWLCRILERVRGSCARGPAPLAAVREGLSGGGTAAAR